MYSLEQALQTHELIVLRVIGEWWELDLTGEDKAASVRALTKTLPQLDFEQELTYLPPEEAQAMYALVANNGRMSVSLFSRQFGDVRMMGPGALEREEPWFDPASPAEALWYRGFLYKGFDQTVGDMAEYFFIPPELLALLPQPEPTEPPVPAVETVRTPANTPTHVATLTADSAPEVHTTATTDAVDDMTTLLAMAQTGRLPEGQGAFLKPYLYEDDLARLALLKTLAVEMGLLRKTPTGYRPAKSAVGWLKQSREAQLRALVEAWSNSAWNELHHVPQLICEGSGWRNDPLTGRTALLDALTLTDDWFRFTDLHSYVKKHDPDFQRPNGNYDTWYIRDVETGAYLNGFESWDLVEARLLSYLLVGPLTWLGMTEVGDDLFRLTPRALAWLNDGPLDDQELAVPIVVNDDATLLVPFNANRYQRFQAARIADPLPVERGRPFSYRITPKSLALAQAQKITADRALEFLKTASNRPLPASTKRALERWAENGTESRLEQVVVLRVKEAEILEKLRKHPKTRPLIGESIGELAAVVPADQWMELCQAAAQLGLLIDLP